MVVTGIPAARLVGGLAHRLLWTTMAPFISLVVPADKVGKALAVVFSGNSLGMALTPCRHRTRRDPRLARVLPLPGRLRPAPDRPCCLAVAAGPPGPRCRPPLDAQGHRPARAKSVAITWPLLVLAHFALFTYILPFIREAGLPDYAISLSLTVLGASGLIGIWVAGVTVDSRPRRSLIITTAAVAVAMLLLPLGGGTGQPGPEQRNRRRHRR